MARNARLFFWFLLLLAGIARAEGPVIPEARDLRAEGEAAALRRVPLLIMFHTDECVWCARMEREFLQPMRRSGACDEKVRMVKVALDPGAGLTGFDGRPTTGAALAKHYGVTVTPTLLFLDGRGYAVADRMVGLTTPDYFGAYLDAALDNALARVRNEPEKEAATGGPAAACRAQG